MTVDLRDVNMPMIEFEETGLTVCHELRELEGGNFRVNGNIYGRNGIAQSAICKNIISIRNLNALDPGEEWVTFGPVKIRRFGQSILAIHRSGRVKRLAGPAPTWLPAEMLQTSATLDLAYSRYLEETSAKLLTWDEKIPQLRIADFGEYRYVCSSDGSYWVATRYMGAAIKTLGVGIATVSCAKSACARDANSLLDSVPRPT